MKNGILLIDKPKNMTSRDVVNIVSKKLKTKKVGHTGTLDPIATGLLIICLNKATSLVEIITSEDKEYIAKVRLGLLTDTLDVTGNVLKEDYNYIITSELLEKTLNSFIGDYMQEVPLYSAIKINGKKLYEYARNNESIELPKRLVSIKEIALLDFNKESFSFRVVVSKGTYIRSLIRDIGDKMNILMTMEELRRTKIEKHSVLDANNLESITYDSVIEVKDFFDYPQIIVDDIMKKKVLNGVKIKKDYHSNFVLFLDNNEELLAIYKKNEKNEMCMYKLF